MAAAYAALVSLSHILHQIRNPPPTHHFWIPREQIECVQEQVSSLINFLEKYSSRRSHGIEDLERRIVSAVYEAEDIIESYVVRRIQTKYTISQKMKSFSLFCRSIQMGIKEVLSIQKVLKKKAILDVFQKFTSIRRELDGVEDVRPDNVTEASSLRSLPGGKNIMVGFNEQLDQIRNILASDDPKRLIFPIVGMGGIGKTTLAANAYTDPYIIETFIVRAWVSVSLEYKERDIMIALLQQINSKTEGSVLSADKLGVLLHKELFGRKYLIVLDDMWEFEAWEKLQIFLPDNSDGSRILVTTRQGNLATEFGSCIPHQMTPLDDNKSWDLIYEYVKEDYPIELEEIGRSIARGCGGLPLVLVVIGGLLAKSEKTREFWEYVKQNVTATANDANDEQCRKILRLSYSQLPVHLKPCFLYLAVFPKNFEIRMSRLIRLWVAEGFIKPSEDKSLEEVAEGYLKDLLDRNLVLISKWGHSGKVKSCSIHDYIWEVCTTEAQKNKFLCISKLDDTNTSPELESKRRLSIHSGTGTANGKVNVALTPGMGNRSFLNYSAGESRRHVSRRCNLLRVLDVVDSYSMDEIMWLINSRYITCAIPREFYLSSLISLFWNLQTLVLPVPITLPSEFWKMPQLRHLMMPGISLADPLDAEGDIVVLKNLLTLKTVRDFKFCENVLPRIPNVKKLGIDYKASDGIESFGLRNVASLRKVESLALKCRRTWENMAFPISLKKLTLSYCQIPWEDMSVVGSLPNLEVLKLRKRAATGKIWIPNADEFCRLKLLLIDWCQLEIWEADDSHFPSLEHLQLIGVRMEEFPMDFAQISSLRTIDLNYCCRSLFLSAKKMSDDREDFGFEDIQIRSFPTEESRTRERNVVRLEDELETLKRHLLEESQEVEVISICGMGGLGKTTLAREIFYDPEILFEFPIRLWVEVSVEFSKRNIFLSILREFTRITEEFDHKTDMELARLVANNLGFAKFLLVMDDVWTRNFWDELQIAFGDNMKGKVLITTRIFEIGRHTNGHRDPHRMRFMNIEESWLLFRFEVFGKPEFPPELKGVASAIMHQCDGLPLVIVVIGGILANKLTASDEMSSIKKAFEDVYESFTSTYLIDDPGRRIEKITSLCYDQLPYHLRKCFLYVGMFPAAFEIPTWKLIRLWIAEGLIFQEDDMSLEGTAEKYLNDLINSNLLIADKFKADGKLKTCRIHGILYDFCEREAGNERENFFQEIKMFDEGFIPPDSEEHRHQRLCIHSNVLNFLSGKPYYPSVSSFVCFSKEDFDVLPEYASVIPAGFKQLNVLDIMPFKITVLPSDMYQLLHLRYFALSFQSAVLPAAFSKFSNIQTLIVNTTSPTLDIKADIFDMIELRHFKTNASATLPKPGTNSKGGAKIQTLGMLSPESCTEEVFDRARNLKKLGIRGKLALLLEDENRSFESLGKLENLEKLKLMNDVLHFPAPPLGVHGLPPAEKFPIKLRSLTLCDTFLEWRYMSILGSLENLEVLKLKDNAFRGKSWVATDGGFPHLEILHIGRTDLAVWAASHHHFPRLKRLHIRNCEDLQEVPLVLADVPNFQHLDLFRCKLAVASANKIYQAKKKQEDQQFGNARRFSLSIFNLE